MLKTILLISTAALTLSPLASMADSWSCRHSNDVREIHIERSTSEPVPCQVVYKKLTEGVGDQVLWSAENDAEYCEQKATDFVAKQEGWGWTCVETIAEKSSEAESMPAESMTTESSEAESMPAEDPSAE